MSMKRSSVGVSVPSSSQVRVEALPLMSTHVSLAVPSEES
jgi:hypothetical protein